MITARALSNEEDEDDDEDDEDKEGTKEAPRGVKVFNMTLLDRILDNIIDMTHVQARYKSKFKNESSLKRHQRRMDDDGLFVCVCVCFVFSFTFLFEAL